MTNEDKSAVIGVSLHSYDTGEASDFSAKEPGTGSLVQQQFADEVDINTIVRRFGVGALPAGSPGGVYGDFSGISNYDEALEAVERAQAGFMALPADVRDRFRNDPGELIRMASSVPEEEFVKFMAPEAPVVAQGGVVPPAPMVV